MAKRYVALLRGINVGGRNKVAMADLRKTFEDGGYDAVRTYIQSGNVLFESAAAREVVGGRYRAPARGPVRVPLVVVVGRTTNSAVVDDAPKGSVRRPRPTTPMSCS